MKYYLLIFLVLLMTGLVFNQGAGSISGILYLLAFLTLLASIIHAIWNRFRKKQITSA
ncbi:hypothetical protein LG275_07940 [Chryseomicrobium palamuruense]